MHWICLPFSYATRKRVIWISNANIFCNLWYVCLLLSYHCLLFIIPQWNIWQKYATSYVIAFPHRIFHKKIWIPKPKYPKLALKCSENKLQYVEYLQFCIASSKSEGSEKYENIVNKSTMSSIISFWFNEQPPKF